MKLHTISRRLTAVALAGVAAATMSAGAAQSASASTSAAQSAKTAECFVICDVVDGIGDAAEEIGGVIEDIAVGVKDAIGAGACAAVGCDPFQAGPDTPAPAAKPVKDTGRPAGAKPVKVTGRTGSGTGSGFSPAVLKSLETQCAQGNAQACVA